MICGSDRIPGPVVRQGKPVAATACPVVTDPAWVAALDLRVKRKRQFTTMSSPACVIKRVHKQLGTSNHLIHFKSLQEEGNNYEAPIWLVLGWFSVNQSPAEYYEIHF